MKKQKAKNSAWMENLSACGVIIPALRSKLSQVKFAKADTRMVPEDYEIVNSELSHMADLEALCMRVDEAFNWYTFAAKCP
jgi:hypothetical protein